VGHPPNETLRQPLGKPDLLREPLPRGRDRNNGGKTAGFPHPRCPSFLLPEGPRGSFPTWSFAWEGKTWLTQTWYGPLEQKILGTAAAGILRETEEGRPETFTLLGPTHNWPVPAAEPITTEHRSSTECCELCGEPIADGKAFTTNSAGQRAMHVACLNEPEPVRKEPRPTGTIWQHLRQALARG